MSAENFDLLDIDADTVCRICLSQPSQLQNLFSSTIVDGYIIRIPEMVKFCLDIIAEPLDNLPQKICSQCKTDLMKFHSFKQKSKRTDDILSKTFKKNSKSDDAEPDSSNNFEDTTRSNEPKIVAITERTDINHKIAANELQSTTTTNVTTSSPTKSKFSPTNFIEEKPIILNKHVQMKRKLSPNNNSDTKKAKIDTINVKIEINSEDSCSDVDIENNLLEILSQEDDNVDDMHEQHINSNDDCLSNNAEKSSNATAEIDDDAAPSTGIYDDCRICENFLLKQIKMDSHQCRTLVEAGNGNCFVCRKKLKNEKLFKLHQEKCTFLIESNETNDEILEKVNCADQYENNDDYIDDDDDDNVDELILENIKTDHNDAVVDDGADEQQQQEISTEINSQENYRPNSANSISSTSVSLLLVNANYECYICNDLFVNKNDYIDHCKSHNLTCIDCQMDFQSTSELNEHNLNVHSKNYKIKKQIIDDSNDDDADADDNQIDILDDSIEEDTSLHVCKICTKTIKSLSQFEHHSRSHESLDIVMSSIEYFRCRQCRMVFASKEYYDFHVTKHKSILNMTNDCVDYQFLDDNDIDDNDDEADGNDNDADNGNNQIEHKCGVCDEIFLGINAVKVHIINHMTEFLCPFTDCGSQYTGMAYLTTHITNKHLNVNGFQCKHCMDNFNLFDDLQMHMKNYCPERKFACNHCDKKFFSGKALQLHMKIIKGKTLNCSYCDKKFAQNGELKIHERSHTGERPFVCTICGNAYKTSSMRAAHMDAHIQGKTFECTLCDKKLQTRTSYRNHMKRHTEEKKHSCKECGKKFFTNYHANLHASKIHRKK